MQCTDQLHRSVALAHWPPRRIVSLVPSQTELLADLDLEAEVVGITKFCVHPAAWFQEKKRIGGTKTVDIQKVAALEPDLILGNKEENDRAQIEMLAARFPVWMSDIAQLADALAMIRSVGQITGQVSAAEILAAEIEQKFRQHQADPEMPRPKVAYFIWRKPYMVAAAGTFIDDMLQQAGFDNVFGSLSRYPEIRIEMLAECAPDAILLSSEPYPFAEKHVAIFQEACPGAYVRIVDGEMFSWYGSRLRFAPPYFHRLRENIRLAKT